MTVISDANLLQYSNSSPDKYHAFSYLGIGFTDAKGNCGLKQLSL
jgi:hypothetical protein